jgi:hypothetical protein
MKIQHDDNQNGKEVWKLLDSFYDLTVALRLISGRMVVDYVGGINDQIHTKINGEDCYYPPKKGQKDLNDFSSNDKKGLVPQVFADSRLLFNSILTSGWQINNISIKSGDDYVEVN